MLGGEVFRPHPSHSERLRGRREVELTVARLAVKGAVLALALCGLALAAAPAHARCLLKYEKEKPNKAQEAVIRSWRGRLASSEKEVTDALQSKKDPNLILSIEAGYFQAAVELYRAMNGGLYSSSLLDIECAHMVMKFPKSPFDNAPIRALGIGDKLFPGAMVYLPDVGFEGKIVGYWLIPIGKTDETPEPPMVPLPGGLKLPDGALFVLENHIEGPMTKL